MQGGLRSQRGLRRLAAGWAFRTERGLWFHWPIRQRPLRQEMVGCGKMFQQLHGSHRQRGVGGRPAACGRRFSHQPRDRTIHQAAVIGLGGGRWPVIIDPMMIR